MVDKTGNQYKYDVANKQDIFKTNNPISAKELHIINNKHGYGSAD
jgi:hypothetical protein